MTTNATIPLFTSQSKTQPQIRDDILRTLANHLRAIGVANPNVGPSSDYYGIATGLANEICVGLSNGIVNTDNQMPDTAAASFLDRWLALFNLSRTPATQSSGVIAPVYSLTQGYTLVPALAVLVDSVGLRYQVTAGGSYGPGNPSGGSPANLYIPVQSIDAGSASNHANGDQLTWVTYVAFVANNALVGTTGGTDGLSGGNDSEVGLDEPPRARLLQTLQNPPAGGNWSDVVAWVKASSPDVQAGFCYPALLGPATVFFAACQEAQLTPPLSSTSKNRSLPSTLMTGTVIPYVQALYSQRAAVVGASVVNQVSDVALLLSLPAAQTARPSGPGGGWLDGSPWPRSIGGAAPVVVTAVTTTTQFTVNALTSPIPGVSHIAYVSASNWTLYTAIVIAVAGGPGAYTVTTDTPWPNLAADFAVTPPAVFPQAVQQANYLAAVLQGFANLGPGEWTTNASAAVRAFRHPSTQFTWPSSLDASFLRVVEDAGTEVLSVQYLSRSVVTPTVPTPPVTITTTEPFLLTSAAPNILVPRSISWYQQ